MTASTLENAGNRIVTLRRSRTVAAISVVLFALTYSSGLVRRHGLIDGFGHVIGADLLAQRVASQMTRDGYGDRLYDFDLQSRYEQAAVSPETLPGLDPFVTPPYVALVYWPLMPLRHEIAFAIWTALGVSFFVASMLWLGRDYPWVTSWLPTIGLLSLSFFPVIEGLMAGSNQMLSLLLFTAVFLSLKHGYDPAEHLAIGRALAPLRDEGVLIVGSGLSWHNLRMFGPAASAPSRAFDGWLDETLAASPEERTRRLQGWETAPAARLAHPQEDHFVPLMVAVGAAEDEKATRVYHEDGFMGGVTASSYRFGGLR